jgi:FkbH-like protein
MRIGLACGFQPEHFVTFLEAHLIARWQSCDPDIRIGTFGDLVGTLRQMDGEEALDWILVAVEWSDLDPRLSLRRLGGWQACALNDIQNTVDVAFQRIFQSISQLSRRGVVVVSLPTLPMPPVSHMPPRQAGMFEFGLRHKVCEFAISLCSIPQVRIVNPDALELRSPLASRLDVRSDLNYGFPFSLGHADALADLMVSQIASPPAKKGIITDLDDTVWKGILGEVGVEGVSWDLNGKGQIHGLYQQTLSSLAGAGVLIGVASKNDPAIVASAFERSDMLLKQNQVFPIEAGWGLKSDAVSRILNKWNIGADSVVFIDDSPMEIAQVSAVYPTLQCFLFPRDEKAGYELIVKLRETFGRAAISDDDLIRMKSLRRAAVSTTASTENGPDESSFLRSLNAKLRLRYRCDIGNARPLELINKTNQFNLNGKRMIESAWMSRISDPTAIVALVQYEDKFGPLGTISVLSGKLCDKLVLVDCWVMSCRAFSRRIEYHVLKLIFERFARPEIEFEFAPTGRNGPFKDFLRTLKGVDVGLCPARINLRREEADAVYPELYHAVEEE